MSDAAPTMHTAAFDFNGGFTDANGQSVAALDVVEYRFGARRGIVCAVYHCGEATVLFRDTRRTESVNWCHLCKIPEANAS